MAFELKIKNIGKLADAKIRIGQFTVFAGPNNTGKSFVSKVLYSLFNSMNANHAKEHINNLTAHLLHSIGNLKDLEDSEGERVSLFPLYERIRVLQDMIIDSPIGDFKQLDKIMPDLANKAKEIQATLSKLILELESMASPDLDGSRSLMKDTLKGEEQSLTKLQEELSDKNAKEFIVSGIAYKIKENLIQNFQVPKLSDLRGKEDRSSEVVSDYLGKFEFSNGEIEFSIPRFGLQELQQYSKVIYLESPVYWKLKNALEDIRLSPRHLHSSRERISGIPGYFYDLASALKYQYTGDMAFPDVYEKLTGENILGGKIALSESGDLSFQENGRSFSLPVTAMGVANLGVLALLIERKVLDEDSFIFIDEPEAHLHPGWQVVMAETLFELAKGGVNVVIATHSADILKFLEVAVKKNPEYEELVALNHFSHQGVIDGESDFDIKLARIKQELTKPFSDLYIKGLL
ncbi:AAA family ATPase [Candidatus Spongiihabitans sp.]|uniref:AAA family ATPase n=1 Tax=Candidatus Spongiihabitans sp. TaxID=3101308 RepID=UPI003C6EC1AB